MPVAEYDFRCEVCGKTKTVRRAMDDQLQRDPYCDSCELPMARIWTANPIHFKGKDWGHQ
jgi:putative FmdB family regulatory protein